MTNLAARLAELRKAHRLSQEDLAVQVHVSRQAVSKWETGQASPDTKTLIALAEVYGISLDELVGLAVSESPDTDRATLDSDPSPEPHDSSSAPSDTAGLFDHLAVLGHQSNEADFDAAAKQGRTTLQTSPESVYQVYDPRPSSAPPADDCHESSTGKVGQAVASLLQILTLVVAVIPFVYLVLGFLFNAWGSAWVVFFVIPAVVAIKESLKRKPSVTAGE